MENETTLNEIISKIERAFAKAPMPDADNIVKNHSTSDLESQWIRSTLVGRHWKDFTCETLHVYSDSVYFMTSAAYRFFLPAYLICALYPRESDMVGETIVDSLAPPPLGVTKTTEEFRSRISLLQPTELSAVASFFRYMDRHHQEFYLDNLLRNSIEQFWGKY